MQEPGPPKLSIIVPPATYAAEELEEDKRAGAIAKETKKIADRFRSIANVEVILVCTEETKASTADAMYESRNINVVEMENGGGMAQQFEIGRRAAQGEYVLLMHSRTLLTREAVEAVLNDELSDTAFQWGGFRHSMDLKTFPPRDREEGDVRWWEKAVLRCTSLYSNTVRRSLEHVLYFDHCLVIKKDILEKVGGIPDLEIFCDQELSKALYRAAGAPTLFAKTVAVDPHKFFGDGVLSRSLGNIFVTVLDKLGVSKNVIAKIYRRALWQKQ